MSEHPQDKRPTQVLFVDEARHLLSGQSALHSSAFAESPSPEEMAGYVVDMLRTYADVELTAEQRTEAVGVVRALPSDDATMERFVKNSEGNQLLTFLADALKARLAKPSHLL